jgi:acyl carrier protein
MDRDATFGSAVATLRSVARHYTGEITRDTSLALDVGMDSVDLIELTNALEAAFATNIPVEATTGVDTVEDIVEMVLRCVGSTHAS